MTRWPFNLSSAQEPSQKTRGAAHYSEESLSSCALVEVGSVKGPQQGGAGVLTGWQQQHLEFDRGHRSRSR